MKTEQSKKMASRREFLRGGARYALTAGLAAVAAVLIKKRGASLPGQTCINQGICRGCSVYTGCGLPQALSAKQAGVRLHSSAAERGVHAASINQRNSASKRPDGRAPVLS